MTSPPPSDPARQVVALQPIRATSGAKAVGDELLIAIAVADRGERIDA
jgi:hypothetical protein